MGLGEAQVLHSCGVASLGRCDRLVLEAFVSLQAQQTGRDAGWMARPPCDGVGWLFCVHAWAVG